MQLGLKSKSVGKGKARRITVKKITDTTSDMTNVSCVEGEDNNSNKNNICDEYESSVRPIYMESQNHINEHMRSILVDWLVEVHCKFHMVPETLYLTINIIDRYLEKSQVSRSRLQLVGVAALLIASKYEETYPPELHDLVYICANAYSEEDILKMEEIILKTLDYKVTIHSAHAFLVRYLKAADANWEIEQFSYYILDGTLQSYDLLHYLPSQLAAAVVLIARRCAGQKYWSPTLLKYANYCEEDILPVAKAVLAEKASVSSEAAVNKKYSRVATMEITSNFLTIYDNSDSWNLCKLFNADC